MTEKLLSLAAKIVAAAGRDKPADFVLRQELKAQRGLSPNDGRDASHAVFAYYRWLGWLDRRKPVSEQIRWALQMDQMFADDPYAIPESEIVRAVPPWTREHLSTPVEWLRRLQQEPVLWLRCRRGTGEEIAAALGHCHPAGEGPLGDALQYCGLTDLFRTPEFHQGKFELQDLTSQVVGLICGVQPGQTWWDACAGEGGKTLHLSDQMQNRGLIWASDRADWRLKQLKRRTARAGVFNYRAVPWEGGTKLPTKTKFDGILVDAPCSGVGTWQRNPHARWTTTPEDVQELAEVQKQLLSAVIPALKPGAKLVYSVCTLTREETDRVADFIDAQFPQLKPAPIVNPLFPDAPPAPRLTLLPQVTGGNGMYVATWTAPQ